MAESCQRFLIIKKCVDCCYFLVHILKGSKIISPCIANRKILRQDKSVLCKSNIKKDEDINMSWHLVNESVSAEQTKISHTTWPLDEKILPSFADIFPKFKKNMTALFFYITDHMVLQRRKLIINLYSERLRPNQLSSLHLPTKFGFHKCISCFLFNPIMMAS